MTPSPAPLHTLACPTCGAPLEIKVDEPIIRCQYCKAVVENPKYRPPQSIAPAAPVRTRVERPVYPQPSRQSSYGYTHPQRKPRSRPVTGVIVIVFLVLSIGGGALLIHALSSSAGSLVNVFPLQIENPVLMINTDGGDPNVIAGARNTEKNSYALSCLDLGSHKALWSALEQKDYLQVDALLTGDTMVYVVMGTRLVALQLSDGKQAWEASLPDTLFSVCTRCILFQNGQVLVLTYDHSLGAYDATTGHQTWEKHFDDAGHNLYTIGDGVALLYAAEKGAVLGIFNAFTGNEQTHIAPTCQFKNVGDKMETYSNILFDAPGQPTKAFVFYGFSIACVQRWDLSGGKMDWEYVDGEDGEGLGDSLFTPVMLADGRVYFVLGNQLRSLDAATGQQMQTLDETKDYSLVPLLVKGQRLVVRAKRMRGSTVYELWGYDLESGKNLWKRPILKSDPIDLPLGFSGSIDQDTSAWTLRQTPAGLWLITFQAQPNQVNLALVNLDTGELSDQKSVPLEVDNNTGYYHPELIHSWDHLAWFSVFMRIYAIDPEAGTFPYRWP